MRKLHKVPSFRERGAIFLRGNFPGGIFPGEVEIFLGALSPGAFFWGVFFPGAFFLEPTFLYRFPKFYFQFLKMRVIAVTVIHLLC